MSWTGLWVLSDIGVLITDNNGGIMSQICMAQKGLHVLRNGLGRMHMHTHTHTHTHTHPHTHTHTHTHTHG